MRARSSLKIHSQRMAAPRQFCRQLLLNCTQNRLQSGVLLLDREVGLVTLDGRINTDTMPRDVVKLLVGVMGYAAEMERKAILKRTAEGRAVALENGVKMGRKRTWDEGLANTVQEMRGQGLGYGTIGTKLGITASKVRRILNATAEVA